MYNTNSKINDYLLSKCHSLLQEWFPGGTWNHGNYKPLNHVRGDTKPGSFVISTQGQRAGNWKDFADSSAKGSCLLSLFAYKEQIPGWDSNGGPEFGKCMREAANRLGYCNDQKYHKPSPRKPIAQATPLPRSSALNEGKERVKKAQEFWKKAVPAKGTLAERYFDSELLPCPIEARFVPNSYYGEVDGCTYYFPCVIFAFQKWPDDEIVGVERLFITPEGKKLTEINGKKVSNKKTIGLKNGAAIRFSSDDDINTIAIAEGVTTALAYQQLEKEKGFDIDVWATGGSENMHSVFVPKETDRPLSKIIIVEDNDKAGKEAAQTLFKRLKDENFYVYIHSPTKEGMDAKDVWQNKKLQTIV